MKHLSPSLVLAALLLSSSSTALAQTSAPARAAVASTSSRTATAITAPSDPQEAGTDYYLEIDGVKGESSEKKSSASAQGGKGKIDYEWKVEEGESAATPGVEPDEIDVMEDPEEASPAFIKIDGVKGESTKGNVPGVEPDEIDVKNADDDGQAKGNVDMQWKVEEAESAATPGVEPDEIDSAQDDPQPITPDFSILLGGSGGSDDDDEEVSPMEELILNGLQEEGAPAETFSLNYEELKTTTTKGVKLFGFIPVDANVTVEVDAKGRTKVKFPWWGFLATGKDADALSKQIVDSLTKVLEKNLNKIKGMK